MENNKFNVFLQQANVDKQIKNELTFKGIEVSRRDKSWTFLFSFGNFVHPTVYKDFVEVVKSFFFRPSILEFIDVKSSFENKESFVKHASGYFNYILEEVSADKPSVMALKNFKTSFDLETMSFFVHIDKDSTFIDTFFESIVKGFKTLSLNVKVNYKIDEELKPVTEVISDDIDAQRQYIEARTELVKDREEVEVVRHKFNRAVKSERVLIKEIPMDQYQLDQYRNEKGDVKFIIVGEIFDIEIRQLRNGSKLLIMSVADEEDTIVVKRFLNREKDVEFAESLKDGDFVKVDGQAQYDAYAKSVIVMTREIVLLENGLKPERHDRANEKRVEFHLHTKMSNMDAITSASDYVDQAIKWGHEAIAFTDHNGLYAYPEIHNATKGKPIKPIYGVELDVVDTKEFVVTTPTDTDFELRDATYVVFDIETTGLSVTRDQIIEIGAIKVVGGQVVDQFQSFVKPTIPIYEHIIELTQITNEMVEDAPSIREVLPKFLEFIKDSVLVAHNALFDYRFIKQNAEELELEFNNKHVIDTINLARYFYADKIRRFNLRAVARYFKVENEQAHRAIHDAEATSKVWLYMLDDLFNLKIRTYKQINENILEEERHKHARPYHLNVLVQNQEGYKNLFKIVSKSHTTYFHQGPRTPLPIIEKYREGLLLSSGCVNGEVFEAALNLSQKDLEDKISYYDVIEVQPPQAYKHLKDDLGPEHKTIIESLITRIVNTAKNMNKIVIATGDVHYLDKSDSFYRDIYIHSPTVGRGMHPLSRYEERPEMHFLTTDEMLASFSFLKRELAEEIVVKNTRFLNSRIDKIEAFPDELYTIGDDVYKEVLGIESTEQEIIRLVNERVKDWYGDVPHKDIQARIDVELRSIIENDFAPIYYTAYLLVQKSLEDGYLVGSRGSVGSSFLATLLDITEVNPLKPHYRCPSCHFVEFKLTEDEMNKLDYTKEQREFQTNFGNAQSGHDLPNANCPNCNTKLVKDGIDIPFETFLGFDGDKIPDIDLNFSGEYQSKAHDYTRELLGEDHTFRAGTIQTIQSRNAYGYVKKFLEEKNIEMRQANVNRLSRNLEGVRRSTGQHPGGIIVIPKHMEVYDITPIQYPADNVEATWKTTHFDYRSFEDNLLKLDILGHDDPTMIKFLMDYVKLHPDEFPFNRAEDIPLDDNKVYQLFTGTEVIGVKPSEILSPVASYGVPEFGTRFVRDMIAETKPDSFAGLVKISGLSHGTDVWFNNARDLVIGHPEYGKIPFDKIIACRDDIMVQLIEFGLPPQKAFEIMEFVRRGRPSTNKVKWLEYEQEMKKYNVPNWYIWNASKIKYMFPKAHAAAYVTMAMRIAWFKVYKPLLFYSAFFSIRAVQFDYEAMVEGYGAIRNKYSSLTEEYRLTAREEQVSVTLGLALEMTKRGFKFLPVDIEKSEATEFLIEEDGLRMPFTTIDGLGLTAAANIVNERNDKPYSSLEDVRKRARINKTVFEKMLNYGAFKDLPEKLEKDDGIFSEGIFGL